MSYPRRPHALAVLATLVLSAACGSSDTEPLVPAALALANAPATTARIADTTRVVVRVVTAAARPVAGQVVGFTLDGAGTLTQTSATTDAQGEATTTWVLGTTVGVQQLVARVGTLAPLTVAVNVTAGAPASLALRAGNDQTAAAGSALAQPPSLVVRDVAGNPVSGVRVAFVVTAGGGRLLGDTVTTDGQGVATLGAWTLGTVAGPNALVARVVGTNAAAGAAALATTVTATAVAAAPARISALSARAVAGTVGTELPLDVRPTVAIADAFGNAVTGAAVSFSTIRGGVTSARSTTTDARGVAVAPVSVLDTLTGVDTMAVTVPGAASVTFTITRQAAPAARVQAVSGDRQTAVPGEALPLPLVVRVTDRYGNPVPDVPVTFEDDKHVGLTIRDPVQRTDSSGAARSGAITLAAAPVRQSIVARAAGVEANVDFSTVPPLLPATSLKWNWYPEFSGALTTLTNQRSKPVAFTLDNEYGSVAPTTVRLEVIPSYAATVYVFEPNAVVARSEILAPGYPNTVVQVLANGTVGPAILRATLPNGSRYDLPFYVLPPPTP